MFENIEAMTMKELQEEIKRLSELMNNDEITVRQATRLKECKNALKYIQDVRYDR